jgi:hypothetical protein
LATFVWKVFFKPENQVNRSKSVWKEGFRVVTQGLRVEWADVGLQTANGLIAVEDSILVEVAIRERVSVAIIEAQMRVIRLWLRQ